MPRAVRYDRLPTEQPNPHSHDLDRLPIPALLRLMNREDTALPRAVRAQLPRIARAAQLIVSSLRAGGRLVFVGAGTSGRLGVLEAAEMPPTFRTPPSMVQAVIAGGRAAVFRSHEGAEDDRLGARQAIERRVRPGDVVVGIAASGVTPFVEAALRRARRLGGRTVLLTCNPAAEAHADVRIAVATGPEVLAGSTRLKAGTATKLILNMLTLASMVQLGKAYGHLMIDVKPSSRKLHERAAWILQELTRCSAAKARWALAQADGRVTIAVLILRHGLTATRARRRLDAVGGSLRRALHPSPRTTRKPRVSTRGGMAATPRRGISGGHGCAPVVRGSPVAPHRTA